jgi:hypothetical protein
MVPYSSAASSSMVPHSSAASSSMVPHSSAASSSMVPLNSAASSSNVQTQSSPNLVPGSNFIVDNFISADYLGYAEMNKSGYYSKFNSLVLNDNGFFFIPSKFEAKLGLAERMSYLQKYVLAYEKGIAAGHKYPRLSTFMDQNDRYVLNNIGCTLLAKEELLHGPYSNLCKVFGYNSARDDKPFHFKEFKTLSFLDDMRKLYNKHEYEDFWSLKTRNNLSLSDKAAIYNMLYHIYISLPDRAGDRVYADACSSLEEFHIIRDFMLEV